MSGTAVGARELVQAWGFARDQGRWDDLLAIFHPGGEIAVSWFRGPYSEFVAHCQRNFGRVIKGEYVTLSGSIGLPSKRCPPAQARFTTRAA